MLRLFLLAAAWLLWSGPYSLEHPLVGAFGVLSVIGVTALHLRMRRQTDHGRDATVGLRVLLYVPWLLKEIAKSSVAVSRIVLDPKLPIEPCIVKVKATQRGEGGRALFANSITLTPGTISLSLSGHTIWVHALTREMAEDAQNGDMDKRVTATEEWRG